MALIKCPECGKEVSDKAPACIHCGFPLEKSPQKVDVLTQTRTIEKATQQVENIPTQEAVHPPKAREESNSGCLPYLIVCGVIIVLGVWLLVDNMGAFVWGVILPFVFLVLFLGFCIHTWSTADPKEVKENWDKEKYNDYKFTCPMCGSKKVKKIGTMNRAASVATVGLASSKIGKQYECDDCKHKW